MMCFRAVTLMLVVASLAGGCIDADVRTARDTDESDASSVSPSKYPVFDIRSVTLDARRRPEPELLVNLRDMGVTHVTLVSFGWQESVDDPNVRVDTTGGWYSESHDGIRALARQADTLGMGVILKPHVWIGGYDEAGDRSNIGFASSRAWTRWETDYRDFLMTYARLASEVDADVLVLGTELRNVATSRPNFWRELARDVRTVYDGDLTYAANWHEEYRTIEFWDALDYVGVQAYFPLADGADPSLGSLRARWQTHREALAQVHRRTGKPVLFTEIGYRSARTTAEAPWRWPERGDQSVSADSTLQAHCYRAFLSTMEGVSWFAGGIIWKWHPDGDEQSPTAFTPQGKPAEHVLRRWFASPTSDSMQAGSRPARRMRE